MIIYEVNLHVDRDVAAAFRNWLRDHIDEMLTFEGFENALWFEVEADDAARAHWCIHYQLLDRAALDRYLDTHAGRMRDDGVQRFPNRFAADRRILSLVPDW